MKYYVFKLAFTKILVHITAFLTSPVMFKDQTDSFHFTIFSTLICVYIFLTIYEHHQYRVYFFSQHGYDITEDRVRFIRIWILIMFIFYFVYTGILAFSTTELVIYITFCVGMIDITCAYALLYQVITKQTGLYSEEIEDPTIIV